jgi:hypothetical protein
MCRKISLGISQEKEMKFDVSTKIAGKREILINANNDQVSKSASFEFDCLDKPEISITELEYPEKVKFDDELSIGFVLAKKSRSDPDNLTVRIKQESIIQMWDVKNLNDEHKFVLQLKGKDLSAKTNEFAIIADYRDKKGEAYQAQEKIYIELEDINIWQRIYLFFNKISRNLENLISKKIK